MSRDFEDENGRKLTVGTCGNPGYLDIAADDGGVCLAPEMLPDLTAALYAAAGKPEPIVLDRPDHPRASLELAGATFSVRSGGVEEFRVHGGTQSGVLHTPDAIRRAAARLAVLAEQAEAEPDPAEVEELTGVLWDAMKGGPAEAAARAALKWFRDKQQRGEDQHA